MCPSRTQIWRAMTLDRLIKTICSDASSSVPIFRDLRVPHTHRFYFPGGRAATANQTVNVGQLNEHVTYRLNDDCATTSNYSILLLLLFVGEISFANIYIYNAHATSSLAGRAIISETNYRRSGATQCARDELAFNNIPLHIDSHWYKLYFEYAHITHILYYCVQSVLQ